MPQMEQRGDVITVSDELVDAMTLRGWKLSEADQVDTPEAVAGPGLEVRDNGVIAEAPADPQPEPEALPEFNEPTPEEAGDQQEGEDR